MTSIYCELAYTPAATITTIAGTVTPAAQIKCESDATPFTPLTLTPTANFPNVSYQWEKSNDGATWTSTGATGVSYTPPLLQTSPGVPTRTMHYRCVVSSSSSCTVSTGAVTVSISTCVLPVNPHLRSRMITTP
ncbi:MAG: hypothetical protein LBS88_02760 [Tannerellaceae bacterium]|nr:hypothetical protein [Tannerellaceae bacterium]